ncbi:hypothetical protein HN51_016159 [Arachis hypogaea]
MDVLMPDPLTFMLRLTGHDVESEKPDPDKESNIGESSASKGSVIAHEIKPMEVLILLSDFEYPHCGERNLVPLFHFEKSKRLRRLVQFEEEEDEHIEPNVVYAGENIHLSNDENVIFAREKRHLSSYSRSTSSKGTSQQEHIAQSSSIQNEVHSHSLSDADFLNNEEVNGVAISRKKWNTTWFVIVVDEQGVEKSMHLKVKDAFSLHHSRKRVLIEWNGSGQPIGESGGLLGGVLGLIASNFNNFPIMYKTWHKVPLQYKDAVFENTIKEQVNFLVNYQKGQLPPGFSTEVR